MIINFFNIFSEKSQQYISKYCQRNRNKDKEIFNDSIAITAIIPDDYTSIGKIDNYLCLISTEKFLSKGDICFISGTAKCKSTGDKESSLFYNVIYKNESFYIEKSKVVTTEDYFDSIYNLNNESRTKFLNSAIKYDSIYHKIKIIKAFDYLKKTSNNGIAILNYSIFDESKYTEGTSFKISLVNTGKRKIKYLWFNLIGYNPVGDVVKQNGKVTIQKKAVGPINANELVEYNFEYVWFTDIVEKFKLSSIKLQYFDGTFKTIDNINLIYIPVEFSETIIEEYK